MKMIVQQRFLVSFMVDARGGAMRGCRHSGVRVIIPPRKASSPMRITCRYLKKDKLVHAPPLMEGEALASRILEMGPAGAKFLGPVILEVPHFASLRGKEREIVILRSDNGETWREHTLEATEEAVQEVLNESFDGEELKQLEDLNTSRITRILTTDFPQYFAIVTRIRQEVHAIGPDGGMVSSTVVPQVQAVFPQGALTKKIKVGLQAQPISPDLAAKLLGNRVAVSPIVTVEPRRRKFHKPITLTLPVPQAASKGMINQYSGDAPTLRLLCSITGGTTRAQWEDVTGSTPLTFVNDCVSFTTTVSARFWLMDCGNIPEATRMATELYREAIHVPFMSKFAVFAKRHQLEEARMRVFCMTDDREDKTLETQEQFVEVAKSRDVEVLEGKTQYLEFAGNLVPVTKSGDQLAFNFYAFRENRLPFTVRVKDQHTESVGRIAFMRQPKVGRGDAPQNPICNLNIALPDTIQPEPAPSEPDLLSLEKKYTFLSISKADTIHKADLRLSDISNMLDNDWVGLARELDISDSDINIIKSQYPENAPQQALVMLRLWMQSAGNKATGNTLEKGLRKIGRVDIVNQCIFNVEPVTDDKERAVAKAQIDTSVVADSPNASRKDAALNRDASMDVSYDEHDMMKEAESAEEDEDNQKNYQGKSALAQAVTDLSPTYEREEKKYAAEEKVVTEDKVSLKQQITQDFVDEFMKDTETAFEEKLKERIAHQTQDYEKVPDSYVGKSEIVEETIVKAIADRSKEEPTVETVTVKETITRTIEDNSKHEPFDESYSTKKDDVPEKDIIETTVTKRFDDGSHSIITTKTTERRTFIVDDDETGDGIQEKIVLEKRIDSELPSFGDSSAKTEMLQKLGEELGKLDDRLEETFKEKRRAELPDEAAASSVEEAQITVQPRTKASTATSYQVVETSIPTHPTEPLQLYKTSEPMEFSETSEPLLLTQTTQPLQVIDISEPLQVSETSAPIIPTETTKPIQLTDISEPLQLTETTEPLLVTEISEPSEPIEASEPVELAEISEPLQLTDQPDPSDQCEAIQVFGESEPCALPQSRESSEPTQVLEINQVLERIDQPETARYPEIPELPEEPSSIQEQSMHVEASSVSEPVELHEPKEFSEISQIPESEILEASQVTEPESSQVPEPDSSQVLETEPAQVSELEPFLVPEPEPSQVLEIEPSQVLETELSQVLETEPSQVSELEPFLVPEPEPSQLLETEPSQVLETEPSQVLETELSQVLETEPSQVSELEPSQVLEPEPSQIVESTEVPEPSKVQETSLVAESIELPEPTETPEPSEIPDTLASDLDGSPSLPTTSFTLVTSSSPDGESEPTLITPPTTIQGPPEDTGYVPEEFTQTSDEKMSTIVVSSVEETIVPEVSRTTVATSQHVTSQPPHKTTEPAAADARAPSPQDPRPPQKQAAKTNELVEADLTVLDSSISDGPVVAISADSERPATDTTRETTLPSPPPSDTTPVKPSVTLLQPDGLSKPSEKLSSGVSLQTEEEINTTGTRNESEELTKRMTDVTSSLASTLDSITAASDSFDGTRTIHEEDDEQLMMRDFPRWEEEEIQADETEEPRAIKAEIKLLVKTTEPGKESIEIRSITEFVDVEDKHPGGFGAIISRSPDQDELVQTGERVFTLHRKTSPGRTPSPRFLRPLDTADSSFISEEPSDDFNLMSQVRDIEGATAVRSPGKEKTKKRKQGKKDKK